MFDTVLIFWGYQGLINSVSNFKRNCHLLASLVTNSTEDSNFYSVWDMCLPLVIIMLTPCPQGLHFCQLELLCSSPHQLLLCMPCGQALPLNATNLALQLTDLSTPLPNQMQNSGNKNHPKILTFRISLSTTNTQISTSYVLKLIYIYIPRNVRKESVTEQVFLITNHGDLL